VPRVPAANAPLGAVTCLVDVRQRKFSLTPRKISRPPGLCKGIGRICLAPPVLRRPVRHGRERVLFATEIAQVVIARALTAILLFSGRIVVGAAHGGGRGASAGGVAGARVAALLRGAAPRRRVKACVNQDLAAALFHLPPSLGTDPVMGAKRGVYCE